MVRSRLPLQYIEDDRRRRATFAKRLTGIKKKAMELSKLCAIPVLLICCAGDHVETWPENDVDIRHIVEQYRILGAEDRERRKLDLRGYIRQQTKKMSSEHERLRRANIAEHQLFRQGVVPEGAAPWEIIRVLDAKLVDVNDRISLLKAEECGSHWLEDQTQLQCLLDNQTSVDLDSIMGEETMAANCANALVPLDGQRHPVPHQDHPLLMPTPSWTWTTTTPTINTNNVACHPMLGGSVGYGAPGATSNVDVPARLICDGGFDATSAGGLINIPAGAVNANTSTSDCYYGNYNIGCGLGRNNNNLAAAATAAGVGGHYLRLPPWRPQTSTAGCVQFRGPENYDFTGGWMQNPSEWQ